MFPQTDAIAVGMRKRTRQILIFRLDLQDCALVDIKILYILEREKKGELINAHFV